MFSIPRRYYWLFAVSVLLIAVLLRGISLTNFPIFLDEALHIDRAYRVLEGDWFNEGFSQNKWLYSVIIAVFTPQGPESIFVSRYATILVSLVTVSACIKVGTLLDRPSTGLLAGLLYAIVPFAVFHERQALVDPTMTAFSMLAIVCALYLIRERQFKWALGLFLFLILAYLTKLAALAYFFVPLVAAVVLTRSWSQRIRSGLLVLFSIGAAAGALVAFYGYLARLEIFTLASYQPERNNVSFNSTRFFSDLTAYFEIMVRYYGVVLVGSLVLGLVLLVMKRQRRVLLFLFLTVGGLTLVPFIATRPVSNFLPRYVSYTIAPLVLLSAYALQHLSDIVRLPKPRLVMGGILLLIAIPSLWFMSFFVTNPRNTPLVDADRSQYITNTPSSFEYQALTEYMLARSEQEGRKPYLLVEDRFEHMLAYVGLTGAGLSSLRLATDAERHAMATALARGDLVFIADDVRFDGELDLPLYGEQTVSVATFAGSVRELEVSEVVAAEEVLASLVYELLVASPASMISDLQAVSSQIDTSERYVLPANFADALDAQPLALNRWPATEVAAEAARPQLGPDQRFAVILIDETVTDPERHVLLAMGNSAYLLQENWSGLVHSLEYVTPPDTVDVLPNGARFEGVISLEAHAIVDQTSEPGESVRIRTEWRTDASIEDSFDLFIHLLDADGQLVAQSDGTPVNGLRPTTSWMIDETIVDRRVLHIPAEQAAGVYQLVVGIYLPQNGLRLPITSVSAPNIENNGDSVTLGTVRIR